MLGYLRFTLKDGVVGLIAFPVFTMNCSVSQHRERCLCLLYGSQLRVYLHFITFLFGFKGVHAAHSLTNICNTSDLFITL